MVFQVRGGSISVAVLLCPSPQLRSQTKVQSTVFPVPPYAKVLSVTVGSVLSHLEMVCLKLHCALDAACAPAAFPVPGDDDAARAVDIVDIAAIITRAMITSRLLGLAKS